MHRWFFANEREECEPKVPAQDEAAEELPKEAEAEKEIPYTDWPFCVRVKGHLQGNEYLAITGNCAALGNWQPDQVYLMDAVAGDCNELCHSHEATVRLPRDKDIEYRYCIVGYNPLADEIIIRRWEVTEKPRLIRTCQNLLKSCDRFGLPETLGAKCKIDRGWATTETYVQFKIFNAPFYWLKQTPRLLHLFLRPMYETAPPNCGIKFLEPLRLTTVQPPPLRPSENPTHESLELAFVEVANLCFGRKLHFQVPSGARCGPEDLQLFHCTIMWPMETLYRLDLYSFAHKAGHDEPPYYYGYGFVQPEQLVGSEGQLRIKISCASTHRPLIEMSLRYLIIRPVASIADQCNLSHTFERHWREAHSPLDIGHRGTGNTYRLDENLHRENTLYAFKRASQHHADMVELDVQLTKDAQVVVYHDHTLRFSLGSAWNVEKLLTSHDVFVFPHEQLNRYRLMALTGAKRGDHIVIPFEALNYEELKLAQPLRYAGASGCDFDCDRHLFEQQPFPLLSDMFDMELSRLPESLGFNIELKWPQQDSRRRWQENGFKPGFDRNFYVDTILEVVFRLAGRRRVIFSSFDADICLMIRFKQNLYPVILLLLNPERPMQFLDQRVSQLENGVFLSYIFELFGLNLHSNILLKQPLILGLIKDLHMHAFCWGAPNNEDAVRGKLKRYGVVGVTYDRIDQKDQLGAELQGVLCCIDSPATRSHIRRLQQTERVLKCARL